eukprot:g16167.t1
MLLWSTTRTMGRAAARQDVGYKLLRLLLVIQLAPAALAKCPNWCSQHGICTGPGDDAFCICEMGFQGDDCGTRLCPKGDDPLTTDQADRALILRTWTEDGPLSGELSLTFNGETTFFDADARRTGDQECASALQALPNIDRVACTRVDVGESGGADYLISLLSFPTIPWENNHYGHFGNPALDAFSCNISSVGGFDSSPSCELIDVVTENVKEYAECSHHGTCVRETGRCECSFGFRGEACDDISDSDDAQVILAEGPFFTGSTLKLRANRGLSPDYDLIRAIAGPHDVLTLTGTGDLILQEGTLHIQPPPSLYPLSRAGSETPSPTSTTWGTSNPPKALTVSGGSLDVNGGGAAVRSTRGSSPALLVSVGLLDQGSEGDKGDDVLHGNGVDGMGDDDEEAGFSFSDVALAVNVRESSLGAGAQGFHLLELSVGGKGTGSTGIDGGNMGDVEDGGSENMVLLSVRGDGRVSIDGGGGVLVKDGDLEVSQGEATFKGGVIVGRGLDVVGDGGVAVSGGGGVRVADGGFEVSTTSHTTQLAGGEFDDADVLPSAAVGVVSARHPSFSGDVLRVDAEGAEAAASGAVLLKATAGGQDVFQVKATGATSINAGGLDVEAGGLKVRSGGAVVSSGGLTVDGGLILRSGTLVIGDGGSDTRGGGGGFEVAHGGIRAASSDASTSALSASAVGAGFGGAVLSISAPESAPSSSFRLLQATVGGGGATPEDGAGTKSNDDDEGGFHGQNGDDVFFVDGTGRVTAGGGLETGPIGTLVAKGGLVSEGSTVLERKRAARDDSDFGASGGADARGGGVWNTEDGEGGGVEVDASLGTFFEVPDDGRKGSANVLRIKGEATAGQILMLRNGDADPTSGAATIPPGYTVLFIHDGSDWRDVRVLEAAVRELHGVTSFSAAADLDIGDFSLKARHLVSSGSDAGGVAVFGGGGVLMSDKRMSWNTRTGTLTVPRLQASEVAEGMDFKGKPARNIALVNATIDRIPFLKTARLMLETGTGSGLQQASLETSRALAMAGKSSGPGYGLAALDKKGELSRADGVTLFPGGILDIQGLGPHLQHGDVDFQGSTARNLSLAGVSSITDLDRLEVRRLSISTHFGGHIDDSERPESEQLQEGPASVAILTNEGELRSAGEAFAIDPATGTLLAPRIGPHAVAGEVDFLGHRVRNVVLEGPEIRGIVPSLHVNGLRMSPKSSVSHGHIAVFSAEISDDEGGSGGGKSLGLASGGEGLSWREGALQNVKLGGTTKLEGDLDMGGHRLLNVDLEVPDLEHIEELTVRRSFKLDMHKSAPSLGAMLVVGDDGSVDTADPATLKIRASSASLKSLIVSEDLWRAEEEGNGAGAVLVVGKYGELNAANGLMLDNTDGTLVVEKISGHEVTGTVDFAGHELVSPALNFTAGGGVAGLSSLFVGDEGLDVSGVLSAASDVMVEGSVTVAGAVMGRGPYMDTSDVRLKTEVREISAVYASAVVKGLRPVTYALKPDAFPTPKVGRSEAWTTRGRRQLGFIAQEVENVAPEVVAEDGNGYKTVAYSRLVPTLVAALSSALDRLDRLEGPQSAPLPATLENELSPLVTAAATAVADEASTADPSAATPGDGRHFSGDNAVLHTVRKHGRRTATVGEDGHQAIGNSDSESAVFDLTQLWVENTALRVRVGEMEKQMVELERKLEVVAEMSGATARNEA